MTGIERDLRDSSVIVLPAWFGGHFFNSDLPFLSISPRTNKGRRCVDLQHLADEFLIGGAASKPPFWKINEIDTLA